MIPGYTICAHCENDCAWDNAECCILDTRVSELEVDNQDLRDRLEFLESKFPKDPRLAVWVEKVD